MVDPNRSKLVSQENVATTPAPYPPLLRTARSYDMLPSAGAVNRGQVAWQVGSLLSHVWSPWHVLVVDPNRSKLVSQENVATTPTPYPPLLSCEKYYN